MSGPISTFVIATKPIASVLAALVVYSGVRDSSTSNEDEEMKYRCDFQARRIVSEDDPELYVWVMRIMKEGPWEMLLNMREKRIGFRLTAGNIEYNDAGQRIWFMESLCVRIQNYGATQGSKIEYYTNTDSFVDFDEQNLVLKYISAALSVFSGSMSGPTDEKVAELQILPHLQSMLDAGNFLRAQ